jgi:zinc protease
MSVAAVRRDRLPEAALSLVLPAGADSTSAGDAGLASLVAKVLPEGAGGRSAREMAVWLDGLGLHFDVAVGYDAMILRVHALSEQLEPALDALSAVALEPDFLEIEVERCRGERLDAIRRSRDDPADVAADVLAELLYGEHPYGRLPRGRLETVEHLGRADLAEFHGDRFSPRVATLVACGDLPDDFEDLVTQRFGSWRGPEVDGRPAASVQRVSSPGIVLVDRPGSGQSEIRIAGIGLRRGDPDEPAARVTNAIFGGLFNSRLNLNLREDKGWTYGARSRLALRRLPGPATVQAAVETAVTADAVREMLGEAGRMGDSLPTDGEMRTAAGALTRSLPLRFETNRQIAATLVEQVVYDLPDDYWSAFPARIEAVSRRNVQELAVRLLDPGTLVVLVVGDAEAVLPGLENLGSVTLREAP